ncbi:uncharacterized protein LOC129780339 [Toxorhynchites rutilus septentrionalis]|uniref:uncharacterized protein LOC129780339 n=1 Tax=Toxorhynchites rutilus septentrionalis TaxID=329112 RepID=UPI002478E8D1|nr:uncharacterized protein LOC129780339 [Toxorhynchites rutilus septentrionalis]XP_055644468.1 uncharacterized protein LOC129780339 [Toxorhynchites rutilus septentrionalis]XP_055644469.1 uncharacterized protein LOC129780339 [Toxorhynchites rutilus septentrionalis]XP_055644470.1 uncharacterized protein LOC129780339 [Toxorhynchites rutilus septentrionalis]XP_055644471.1 uncharacterized protein LOC129780339 [Toxorhynchites rutilus septentrionalis]XP_055644472.1 uncharacterized protein LOC12978033
MASSFEIETLSSNIIARTSIELYSILERECHAKKRAVFARWELYDKEYQARKDRGWTAEDDKWKVEIEVQDNQILDELEERQSRYRMKMNEIAAAHGIQLPQIRMYAVKKPPESAEDIKSANIETNKNVECGTEEALSKSVTDGRIVANMKESFQINDAIPIEKVVSKAKGRSTKVRVARSKQKQSTDEILEKVPQLKTPESNTISVAVQVDEQIIESMRKESTFVINENKIRSESPTRRRRRNKKIITKDVSSPWFNPSKLIKLMMMLVMSFSLINAMSIKPIGSGGKLINQPGTCLLYNSTWQSYKQINPIHIDHYSEINRNLLYEENICTFENLCSDSGDQEDGDKRNENWIKFYTLRNKYHFQRSVNQLNFVADGDEVQEFDKDSIHRTRDLVGSYCSLKNYKLKLNQKFVDILLENLNAKLHNYLSEFDVYLDEMNGLNECDDKLEEDSVVEINEVENIKMETEQNYGEDHSIALYRYKVFCNRSQKQWVQFLNTFNKDGLTRGTWVRL